MPKYSHPLITLLTISLLQGCASAVITGGAIGGAVHNDRRTAGTIIDDQGIEFKAANALFKNKAIYEQSHINITSYNGLVLLTGETPSKALKQQIENEVKTLAKVRRIFNELTIAAPSALLSRSSDTLITSKIKAKLTVDKGVNPLNIKVVTENGVVYLMGLVNTSEADIATDIVRQSAGVQRVVKLFEYIDN